MPAPSETLVALEQRHAERRLAFERLDAAWPFSHPPRVAVRPALVRTVRPMIPGKPEARFCARLSPGNAAPRSRSRPRTRRLRLSENPTASQPRSPKSDHPYRRPDHLTRFHPSRRPPRARIGRERPRSTLVNPPRTMTRGAARPTRTRFGLGWYFGCLGAEIAMPGSFTQRAGLLLAHCLKAATGRR